MVKYLTFYNIDNQSYIQQIDTKTTINIIKVSPMRKWIALGKQWGVELWKQETTNQEKPLGATQ